MLGNFWPRAIDETRFPATKKVHATDERTSILVYEHQPEGVRRGQIVFLHGLEGSAEAGYIRSLAQQALERGFAVHRKNLRTCGGTEHLCETMYHSGLTSDTRFIVQRLSESTGDPVFVVGFSLGGNVALKLAGELGETEILAGVCAVSTPIDLAMSVQTLDKPSNFLYARRFLSRLRQRVAKKSTLSPDLYSAEGLRDVKSIWEFDDRFTAPLFGFGTAANYYATQSAARYLEHIRVPALLIAAKDDPLVPFEMYASHPAFANHPALKLISPDHGGHLGFISRRPPRFWVDGIVLDWIEEIVSKRPEVRRLHTAKSSAAV
jgi:predicted alpha/beta-fold hydrolase